LKTWIPLGFLLFRPRPQLLDVFCWVPAHVADPDGDAVPHSDDAHLADGVLLEVFTHEVNGVIERQEIAVR
jgi:hypothetical protein